MGGPARFLTGTEAFPFHHIMPIGGETQLTTNDVAVITKQMNSKLTLCHSGAKTSRQNLQF